jgi:hypothetical protein
MAADGEAHPFVDSFPIRLEASRCQHQGGLQLVAAGLESARYVVLNDGQRLTMTAVLLTQQLISLCLSLSRSLLQCGVRRTPAAGCG